MNICRQCFREKSTDIGFNKVRFYLFAYTDSRIPRIYDFFHGRTSGRFPITERTH